MAPSVDLTAHPPPAAAPARIPKLKYRNPMPADQTSLSSRESQDTGSSSIYAQDRSATPDTQPASATSRPSHEAANLTSPSLASLSSGAASSNGSGSSTKKKKKNSVLSFLTLKEPSQLALEQFAEASRQQPSDKGTSSLASKRSGTQSNPYNGRKLPSDVPKVNSKWDGIPESAKSTKNRHSMMSSSGSSAKSTRASWSARASLSSSHGNQAPTWNESKVSVLTTETCNPPNSIVSAAASIATFTLHDEDIPRNLPQSKTTEVAYYSPSVPMASGALPVNSRDAIGEAEPRSSGSTFDGRSSIDSSFNFRADSPASSTDSVDTVVRDAADSIFRKLNDQPRQTTWGESSPSVKSPDDDLVPESHDFLFAQQPDMQTPKTDSPMTSPTTSTFPSTVEHYVPPRPMQNFSRPIAQRKFAPPSMPPSMRSYRTTPASSALPTLYEASLASTESLVTIRDEQEKQDGHDNDDNDADSIAPSTIAPSILSTHWYESPRERLGLGGRLRMSTEASPWDKGGSVGKPKKNRLSMFGIGTQRA